MKRRGGGCMKLVVRFFVCFLFVFGWELMDYIALVDRAFKYAGLLIDRRGKWRVCLLWVFCLPSDIDTKCTVALPNRQREIQATEKHASRADLVWRASGICSISGYQH
jgi:hypothetical protein